MTTRYVPVLTKADAGVEPYPLGSWPAVEQATEAARQTMQTYGKIHGDDTVTEHEGDTKDCEHRIEMNQHGWTARIYAIDAYSAGDENGT
jgi:hypothetical protein